MSPVPWRSAAGPTPFRNAVLAPTCTDSPQGAVMLLIVTRCDRCFSIGCMTGLNVKPEPAASGCQVSGNIPQGRYTVPNRNGAAAFDCAVRAGVIASSI